MPQNTRPTALLCIFAATRLFSSPLAAGFRWPGLAWPVKSWTIVGQRQPVALRWLAERGSAACLLARRVASKRAALALPSVGQPGGLAGRRPGERPRFGRAVVVLLSARNATKLGQERPLAVLRGLQTAPVRSSQRVLGSASTASRTGLGLGFSAPSPPKAGSCCGKAIRVVPWYLAGPGRTWPLRGLIGWSSLGARCTVRVTWPRSMWIEARGARGSHYPRCACSAPSHPGLVPTRQKAGPGRAPCLCARAEVA